jgi:hypothetical protein
VSPAQSTNQESHWTRNADLFLVHPWKEDFPEATILVSIYPELNVVES